MIDELVHYRASLKEVGNDERSGEIVVHCIITLLAKLAYELVSGLIALG